MNNQTDTQTKKEKQAIDAFIERKLIAFGERKQVEPFIIKGEEGDNSKVIWRFFLNHQFFIERGNFARREAAGDPYTEYIRVVKRENNGEIECAEQVILEDAPSEEAIIRSMIEFLFKENLIVVATEDDTQ